MQKRKDNKGRVLNKGENQRKDGTYMYRYQQNGERKTIYAKTLTELREKKKSIEDNIRLGIYTNEYTLNELFDRYLQQNVNLKPRTMYKYKIEYNRWVGKFWIGKKKIKSIVKSDIVLFYKECSDKGLSNGTIKCIHKLINGALNMAYQDDLIRRNYAESCIAPYMKTNKRSSLTKEQTNKFLTTAENVDFGKNYLLAFKLMLLTGMRVGEVTGLTWDDVNLQERYLDVNHQFIQGDENSRAAYHIDTPKTFNGKRKVPISDDLYKLLKELKNTTYFDSYKFKTEVDGYSGFVIHTRTGLPILSARLNEYAKQIVTIYNNENCDDKLPNITCHTCRHTFCTRLAEMGINPHALQKIVGHSSYKTTADIYITVDDNFANEDFFRVMRGVN